MRILRFVAWMLPAGALILGASTTRGQDYPNRAIRVYTQAVGSANDFQARLIAQGLTSSLGQQVVVENQPVFVSLAQTVAKAPPDGYTLLSAGTPIWVVPLLQKTPYDPVTDFATISLIARSINVLAVHPSLPVSSVRELVTLAKARPGVLNYASGGVGGTGHLTGELFNSMAGVKIVHVPYKGGAAALTDLMTGQVQLAFDNPSTIMPLAKAAKLKSLAVTSSQPSAVVPGVPTVASFLPGFEATQMTGVFAPAKTPEAITKRLNQEIVRILNTADLKDKYFSRGIEVMHSTPDEFAATIRSDSAKWGKVIKDAGIRAD